MTSLSLFQAKNTLGSKMKRSIINFCKGDDSTSTLNQRHFNNASVLASSQYSTSYACQKSVPESSLLSSDTINSNAVINDSPQPKRKVTLEEMILKLELEEEITRKEKLKDILQRPGRRSCVNNSDILRSARSALNQYPRFSLDGRDAMYRNFNHSRGRSGGADNGKLGQRMPSSFGGERVVWCKPGVVARLMGLDAIPVPAIGNKFCSKEKLRSMMKRQSLRLMAERRENERKNKIVMELIGSRPPLNRSGGSCSRNGEYCTVNSVAAQQPDALFEGYGQHFMMQDVTCPQIIPFNHMRRQLYDFRLHQPYDALQKIHNDAPSQSYVAPNMLT